MTATTNRSTAQSPAESTRTEPNRPGRRRGAILLLGAVVIALTVQPIGPLDYYWNPFLVGVAFLAAAAATGPRSYLWGAGLVLGFWGLSKVLTVPLEVSWAGAFSTAMIGLGGLLAAGLASRGYNIAVSSVAWPIVFIGLGQFLHGEQFPMSTITLYTAGLALAYGLVELVADQRSGQRLSRSPQG